MASINYIQEGGKYQCLVLVPNIIYLAVNMHMHEDTSNN